MAFPAATGAAGLAFPSGRIESNLEFRTFVEKVKRLWADMLVGPELLTGNSMTTRAESGVFDWYCCRARVGMPENPEPVAVNRLVIWLGGGGT